MKKGQVLIRKHNLLLLNKNFSDKLIVLLSFVMIPKIRNVKLEPQS